MQVFFSLVLPLSIFNKHQICVKLVLLYVIIDFHYYYYQKCTFSCQLCILEQKIAPGVCGGLLYPFLYYILQPELIRYGGHLLQRNIY